MNWYTGVWQKYAVFEGRARRMEYWMFVLINLIVSVALSFVDGMIGTMNAASGLGLLSGVYALAVLLPSIAVGVRRLHDTDRSGWWMLIGLIPLIGAIVLIVFFALEGTQGRNRYGDDPKGEGVAA